MITVKVRTILTLKKVLDKGSEKDRNTLSIGGANEDKSGGRLCEVGEIHD